MPFAIRPYEPRDLVACRALWRELTDRHRALFDDPSIGAAERGEPFDEHLALVGPQRVWIADDGAVVGFAALVPHGPKAELEPIVVSAAYRGRGVGRALVEAIVEQARADGVRQLFVRPVARNDDALRFFHAAGFDAVARVELARDLAGGPAWRHGVELAGRRYRC